MITCRRAAEWISWNLDTELPFSRRFALRCHVWMCGSCRRFRDQLSVIDELVGVHMGRLAGDHQMELTDETRSIWRASIADQLRKES